MPPLVQGVFLLLNCRRLMRMVLKRVKRGKKGQRRECVLAFTALVVVGADSNQCLKLIEYRLVLVVIKRQGWLRVRWLRSLLGPGMVF